jgi:superfamily II DNA helicase RecQ
VSALKAIGVSVESLTGLQTQERTEEILQSLHTFKLLYVTPERIVRSGKIIRILQQLNKKAGLARFVVDVSIHFVLSLLTVIRKLTVSRRYVCGYSVA